MTPYEVVRRAIEFKNPPRLPLRFEELGASDIYFLGLNQFRPYEYDGPFPVSDEWGCRWERTELPNMGQVKGHPLEDLEELSDYHWPDAEDERWYAGMDRKLPLGEGKYVLTGLFMLLFERLHSLRGFENTLVDLLQDRRRLETIADNIVEFDLALIRNLARRFARSIHGFFFTDDWGSEQALFIDPRLWEAVFMPRYQVLFEKIHSVGWHVWMHSCGKINAILDSLIAIGLDVINLQQPQLLGIEQIGARFRGKVCFETLCDIQKTLPSAELSRLAGEARLLIENWADPDGGFILSDYGEGGAIGVDTRTKRKMLEAFLAIDPWRQDG